MQFLFGRHAQFRLPHVVTIGNFDGVHVGHQRVIKQAKATAKDLGLPLTVLLFEPQPKEYFSLRNGDIPPARLTTLKPKVAALKALGVDSIWCLKFSNVRQMTAAQFVDNFLRKKEVAHVVVGDDFRFGCDRAGDFSYLKTLGQQLGFSVEQSDTHCVDGQRISSSRIRHAIKTFDFDAASRLLGRPYSLCGRVIYGKQLGRKIGFPTANIGLSKTPPLQGVFGCIATFPSGQYIRGVANIGSRPTVCGQKVSLEVHLHEFTGELYGLTLTVTPQFFIRAEKKFESVDALTKQISDDNEKALSLFSLLPGYKTK